MYTEPKVASNVDETDVQNKSAASASNNASSRPDRPTALLVKPDNIPEDLKRRDRWVLWRLVRVRGRWTKIPVMPKETKEAWDEKKAAEAKAKGEEWEPKKTAGASSTDPDTWSSYDVVVRAYQKGGYDGIGFVLDGAVDESGLTIAAIDIDKVKDNPERIARAQEIRATVGSYTEISPSGKGVRIFLKAKPLVRSVVHDGLEFYAGLGRFLTVTGHVVKPHTDLVAAPEEFKAVIAKHTSANASAPAPENNVIDWPLGPIPAHIKEVFKFETLAPRPDIEALKAKARALAKSCGDRARWYEMLCSIAGEIVLWPDMHAELVELFHLISKLAPEYNSEGKIKVYPREANEAKLEEAIADAEKRLASGRSIRTTASLLFEAANDNASPPALDDDAEGSADDGGQGTVSEGGATDGQKASKKPPSQAERLLGLASADNEFFHDADSNAFVRMSENGRRAVCRINSERYKQALLNRYLKAYGSPPNDESIRQAVRALEAQAVYECPEREVHLRAAWHGRAIYVDLARDDGAIVEITLSGWKVVHDAPVYFLTTSTAKPLPTPQRNGYITALASVINLATKDDFILAVAWLFGAFGPGPYPIGTTVGGPGSAKSTSARKMRNLVDPRKASLKSLPKNEQDLIIAAQNGYVVSIDNISHLPDWLADALCRLATGGGNSYRKLYTDAEEVVFDSRRPIILNGIGDFTTRGDLADRAITFRLAHIPDDARKTEQEVDEAFEREAPKILGALFSAVAYGLANPVKLTYRPRMADFAEWAASCEGYFDGTILPFDGGETWRRGDFVAAYARNRSEAAKTALAASPLDAPLQALLDQCNPWTGLTSKLWDELTQRASATVMTHGKWPADATRLSGDLDRLASGLRAKGIRIDKKRSNKGSEITITRDVDGTGAKGQPTPSDAIEAASAKAELSAAQEQVAKWWVKNGLGPDDVGRLKLDDIIQLDKRIQDGLSVEELFDENHGWLN